MKFRVLKVKKETVTNGYTYFDMETVEENPIKFSFKILSKDSLSKVYVRDKAIDAYAEVLPLDDENMLQIGDII